MKNLIIFSFGAISLVSCQDEIIERYKVQEPVYLTYTELRKSIKVSEETQPLKSPGKIYYWNNYLFVSENSKGIHVIDNSDPASPAFKTFINIPGNIDMSVKDGILYADSYIDLVALDISNMDDIKEVKRIDSIFPYTIPVTYENLPLEQIDLKKGVVVGYKAKYIEKELYRQERGYYPMYFYSDIRLEGAIKNSINSWSGSGTGVGVGGSMARFTIQDNALYAINQSSQIIIFNISDVANPVKFGDMYVSWGIETLFPYNGKLFIGSQTGMLIYDLANPFQPQYKALYSHVRSCDPVVVDGNYAYVTLRTGTRCEGNINRLDIVDVSNPNSPTEVKTYDMSNPHGLGIDSTTLFVCDGDAGLKVFDVKDKYRLNENLLAQYPEYKAIDVIPLGNVLLLVTDKGIYEYDYSDVTNIKLLSSLLVEN